MARRKRFDIGALYRGKKQPAEMGLKKRAAMRRLIRTGRWKPANEGKHFSEAYRRKMAGVKRRQYLENPRLIQRIDSAITKWWREHPNIRGINSKRMKREFLKHPDAMRKFMKIENNPFMAKLKTKQGFLVRSDGERKIANYLFENKIKALYEAKPLQLDGHPCVPDFFLPEYRMYIEFYGGYPGSWQKKVLKNKLYAKHHIRCVAITPAELRNLDYYLTNELKK